MQNKINYTRKEAGLNPIDYNNNFNYNNSVENCWRYYNHLLSNIDKTYIELVELKGRYKNYIHGNLAIKIPLNQCNVKRIKELEEFYNISINKTHEFFSDFSMPRPNGIREKIRYKVFLYKNKKTI